MSRAGATATRTVKKFVENLSAIEQFEDRYPPHQRVCVRIEGVVLTCTNCDQLPALRAVDALADLAFVATPHGKHWLETFVCFECKKKS